MSINVYAPEGVSVFQAYCRLREDRYPNERLGAFELVRTAIKDVPFYSFSLDQSYGGESRVCYIGRAPLEADFSSFPLITIKTECSRSLSEPSNSERSNPRCFNEYDQIFKEAMFRLPHPEKKK